MILARALRERGVAVSFVTLDPDGEGSDSMVEGFVVTTLDTAVRLNRYLFEELWAINQKKADALSGRRPEMTPDQQKAFDALVEARARFAPLPQKMFEIRASDRWNMAQWFLTNEAAPRANKLLDIFSGAREAGGTRAGGLVARQQRMLTEDGTNAVAEIGFLTTLLWVLLGVAVGVAVTVVYLTNRSIVARYDQIQRYVEEWQADALVIHSVKSCRAFSVGQADVRE